MSHDLRSPPTMVRILGEPLRGATLADPRRAAVALDAVVREAVDAVGPAAAIKASGSPVRGPGPRRCGPMRVRSGRS